MPTQHPAGPTSVEVIRDTSETPPADRPTGGSEGVPEVAAEIALTVAPDGTLRTLYDERLDLTSLGPVTIERASHVEPTPGGLWTADLSPVGGPVLGPFSMRSVALTAEAIWIEAHVLS